MAGGHLVELLEDGLLDRHPLGHGLDGEVHVPEALVLGGPGDAAGDLGELGVGLLLADLLLAHQTGEEVARDLLRLGQTGVHELLLDVLEHDRHTGRGDDLGDLAAHRAGADDRGLEDEHALRCAFRSGEEDGEGYVNSTSPMRSRA